MTMVQKCIDDEDFDRRTVDIVDSGAVDYRSKARVWHGCMVHMLTMIDVPISKYFTHHHRTT